MVFISSYCRVRAESASVACVDSVVDSFIARQVARVASARERPGKRFPDRAPCWRHRWPEHWLGGGVKLGRPL